MKKRGPFFFLPPSWYYTPLVLKQTETVNGYNLLNTAPYPILSYQDFLRIRSLFEDKQRSLSLGEFMKLFDEIACTDWSKMDRNGQSFGGFWDCPPESYGFKNAARFTRTANGEMLYELPFSKRFLLETVKLGCNSRKESVRFSNSIGVWMERKIVQGKLATSNL